MFIENLKRVLKSGWKSFRRNMASSFATTFVFVVLLSLVSFIFIFNNFSDFLIGEIEDKADISVYLSEDFLEENVLKFKNVLEARDDIEEVQYISENEAYQNFVEAHGDDTDLMEALIEVGDNPFLGSLSIRAIEIDQYDEIVSFLEESEYSSFFSKIDYYQRKPVIDKIFSLTKLFRRIVLVFSLLTVIIVTLLVSNTVRLAIFNSSEEIGVMRLVGASNLFIRMPFIAQSMIASLFAIVITNLTFLLTFWSLSSKLQTVLGGFNVLGFFGSHLGVILLIQLGTGLGLSILTSFLATRKYLKI